VDCVDDEDHNLECKPHIYIFLPLVLVKEVKVTIFVFVQRGGAVKSRSADSSHLTLHSPQPYHFTKDPLVHMPKSRSFRPFAINYKIASKATCFSGSTLAHLFRPRTHPPSILARMVPQRSSRAQTSRLACSLMRSQYLPRCALVECSYYLSLL